MRRLFTTALVLSLAFPLGAFAGKDKGKGRKDKGRKGGETTVAVTFGHDEREKFRLFFAEKHGRGNCPPGLAKKNNGCLPPGQAKKRYSVGRPLPASMVIVDVPVELSVRIGPPPRGYRYAIVDGDLVKLAIGTLLVVDAIEGLVE